MPRVCNKNRSHPDRYLRYDATVLMQVGKRLLVLFDHNLFSVCGNGVLVPITKVMALSSYLPGMWGMAVRTFVLPFS
jgi:hypothetical protein